MIKISSVVLVLLIAIAVSLNYKSALASSRESKKSATNGDNDKSRWDKMYGTNDYYMGENPIDFLKEHVSLLPKGKVLDIAMGEGRNGVYLATKGFNVVGVDISEVGLKKAHELAKRNKVKILTKAVDLKTHKLKDNEYDVIILSYYLQRDLFPQIKNALKKGGMAVIETYSEDYLKYNPQFKKEWTVGENEMLEAFKGLKVVRYQNVDDGKTAYISMIVQKK